MRKQCLILGSQRLLTEVLLHELPVFVHSLILLCLWIVGCSHLLVVRQELGQQADIKTTSLLVHERSLHQHGVSTFLEDVLQFLVGNGQAQLSGFFLKNFIVHELLPYLILQVVEFILGEIITSLCHLHDILILVNECLEILHREFVT